MNKEEILKKLKQSELDKDRVIVISGASLVVQGIIPKTYDIDLSCDKDYYDNCNWKSKMGNFCKKIKYKDIFELGDNLHYPDDVVIIDGYKFLNLEKCLEIKKELNRKKDKDVIEKLEKILNK